MPAGVITVPAMPPPVGAALTARVAVLKKIPKLPPMGRAWENVFRRLKQDYDRSASLAEGLGRSLRYGVGVKTAFKASAVAAIGKAASATLVLGQAVKASAKLAGSLVTKAIALGGAPARELLLSLVRLGSAISASAGPALTRGVTALADSMIRLKATAGHLGLLTRTAANVVYTRAKAALKEIVAPRLKRKQLPTVPRRDLDRLQPRTERRPGDPALLPEITLEDAFESSAPPLPPVRQFDTPGIYPKGFAPGSIEGAAEEEAREIALAHAALAHAQAVVDDEVAAMRARVAAAALNGVGPGPKKSEKASADARLAAQLDAARALPVWAVIQDGAYDIAASISGAFTVGLEALGNSLTRYRAFMGETLPAALERPKEATDELNDAIQLDIDLASRVTQRAKNESRKAQALQMATIGTIAAVAAAIAATKAVLDILTKDYAAAAAHLTAAAIYGSAAALAGRAAAQSRRSVEDAAALGLSDRDDRATADLVVNVPGYSGPEDIRGYIERALGAREAV